MKRFSYFFCAGSGRHILCSFWPRNNLQPFPKWLSILFWFCACMCGYWKCFYLCVFVVCVGIFCICLFSYLVSYSLIHIFFYCVYVFVCPCLFLLAVLYFHKIKPKLVLSILLASFSHTFLSNNFFLHHAGLSCVCVCTRVIYSSTSPFMYE